MTKGCILLALAVAPSVAFAQAPTPPKAAPARPPGGAVSEVVVTGQAPPVQTSIDRRSYSVTADLRATSGSIGEALRNVPSVEVDVQGNVSLRGDANVTILVDGKPSGQFRGESRGQALQQLPAERIERVEVITNPSAEFRADGTAGIINLITKKAKGTGLTGSTRITAGNADRVFASGNLGYNDKALSVAADAFLRLDTQAQEVVDERSRTAPAPGFADIRVEENQADIHILGGRLSVDYDVTPATRLSGELRGQAFELEFDAINNTKRRVDGSLTQVFDRGIRIDQRRNNGEVTVGLTHKFGDGHDLKLNLNYELTDYDRTRQGVTLVRLPAAPDAYDRQTVLTDLEQIQFKGDYVRPLDGGARLKLGFDLQRDDNSYDNRGFRGPTGPAAIPDPTLSNLFRFEQQLAQAYVTYERPFGDVTVLAGLRVEDVRIDLDQVTLGDRSDNDYARAYPSLHLAWKRSDTQQFTASYSHRVQRPEAEEFNAFRFLIDPFTYRSGNPRLKPQETHAYELGWQHRKDGRFLLATAYYRENEKVVTDITRDLGGGVLLVSRANVSETRAGGLELVANGRLTPKLSYNVSANLYWNELDASALDVGRTRSAVTASGRASLSWQATPNDFLQVSGFLNARRLTAQGYIEPTGMLNLGYRHKFNDRFQAVITVQDVLNTFKSTEVVDTPTLQTRVRREVDTRLLQVGLVWTFGGGRPRDPGFDFNQGGGGPPVS